MSSSSRKQRRGVAAVEFAVVSPLLIGLLLGLWEVGRIVEVYQILNNACREAGRQAASGELTAEEVQQVVLDYLKGANISTEGMPTPVVKNITDPSAPDPVGAEQLDQFRVTATLPIRNIEYSNLHFFTSADGVLTCSVDWYTMNDRQLTISTEIPTL